MHVDEFPTTMEERKEIKKKHFFGINRNPPASWIQIHRLLEKSNEWIEPLWNWKQKKNQLKQIKVFEGYCRRDAFYGGRVDALK